MSFSAFGANSLKRCHLNSKYEYYSLSSPITMLLEELSLLGEVEAISTFHPVTSAGVKKLAGGIFLTKKAFKSSNKTKAKKERIIFFDQSHEMRRTLSKLSNGQILEVFTRKLGAFEAYKVSVEVLSSFLVNCESKLDALSARVLKIKRLIAGQQLFKKYETVLFFLGEFDQNKKDPNLLIVNDGFVKDLIDGKNLKTYPSQLEYVPWSSKILKKIQNVLFLSVSDLNASDISMEKTQIARLKENKFKIKFRGALSPGIRQVLFLKELVRLDKEIITSHVDKK